MHQVVISLSKDPRVIGQPRAYQYSSNDLTGSLTKEYYKVNWNKQCKVCGQAFQYHEDDGRTCPGSFKRYNFV